MQFKLSVTEEEDAKKKFVISFRITKAIILGILATAIALMFIWANKEKLLEVYTLKGEFVYGKDNSQFYLMGKAIQQGLNPYTNLSELAKIWMPKWTPHPFPCPYPPFVALLCVPLAEIPIHTLVWYWAFIDFTFLVTMVLLLWKWWGSKMNILWFPVVLSLLLLCESVHRELRGGQIVGFLACLFVLTWLSAKDGKNILAGLLLGIILSIKIIAWPLVLCLLLCRKWISSAISIIVFGISNMLALYYLGLNTVLDYYTRVSKFSVDFWGGYQDNMALSAWGKRLFSGIGWGCYIQPVYKFPALVPMFNILIPFTVFLIIFYMMTRTKSFDTRFGLACFASVLLSPVIWIFYFLLLAVPICLLYKRLLQHQASTELWILTIIPTALLYCPAQSWFIYATAFGFGPQKSITFNSGLLTLMPIFAMFWLLWVFWQTDKLERSMATSKYALIES